MATSSRVVALALCLLLAACVHYPRPREPMLSVLYPAAEHAHTLVVLLPGLRDRANVFVRAGFVKAFRDRHVDVDLVAADAHAGYYATGTLERRLHDDIIVPARRRYRRIVFLGVSMGGYGAIRYAMIHPGEVDALVLFSPFLGAGPVLRWLAEPGDEDFHQTWTWLRASPHPTTFLGYGHEDEFLLTDRELARLLPQENVVSVSGGHLWKPWREALGLILEHHAGVLTNPPKPRPEATP